MRKTMVALLLVTALAGCADPGEDDGDGQAGSACDGLMPTDPSGGRSYVCMDTNKGPFLVELYDDDSPITAANFLEYVEAGFYDNTAFHRIVKDFVVQGGGMDQTTIEMKETNAPIKNEAKTNGISNDQWKLSMARTGAPDSATSQFFINVVDNPGLDPGGFSPDGYAVFGIVVAGRDVVQALHDVPTSAYQEGRRCLPSPPGRPPEPSCPEEDVFIEEAYVLREGGAAQEAEDAARERQEEEERLEELRMGEPDVQLELITPGQWNVNGRPDHMMLWALNRGGEMAATPWMATLADGSGLPDGWTLTFDPEQADLAPTGTIDESSRSEPYTDWAQTVATLQVPEDAVGTHEVRFRLGPFSTVATLTIVEPMRVAQAGDDVLVHTVGTLDRNGEEFWSGDFPTMAGTGQAVTGFRLGLLGVAEGEPVDLVVPPPFAYGYSSLSGHELADETLVFSIDHEFQD